MSLRNFNKGIIIIIIIIMTCIYLALSGRHTERMIVNCFTRSAFISAIATSTAKLDSS